MITVAPARAHSTVEWIDLPTLPAQTGFLHEICKSAYSRREFTSTGINQAHREGGKRPVGKKLGQPACHDVWAADIG